MCFSNEWDKYACITYKSWYGDKEINQDDIRKINYEDLIPDHDILRLVFHASHFP